MIGQPKLFISLLQDSRILLIFPDIVSKLKIKTLLLSETDNQNLKKIFPTLLDYRILDPKIEFSSVLVETSNLMLRTLFYSSCTAPALIKVENLDNNNIRPLTNKQMLGLLSTGGISFTSDQFLQFLNIFSDEDLDDLLSTITTYQLKLIIQDFSDEDKQKFMVEGFKYDYDMWKVGIL